MAEACIEKETDKEKTIGVGITGTLTAIDKQNTDSKIGEIYYAIKYPNGNIIVNEITIEEMPRPRMKEVISNIIAREIVGNI